MPEKIELVDILKGEDFLREVYRAAQMSYRHNKESGFSIYTDKHFLHQSVNHAVLGKKYSTPSDMTIDHKHKTQKGYYLAPECFRLIDLHFHPPNSHLHPSPGDIYDCLSTRRVNVVLRDSSSQREIYRDHEEILLRGYEIDYINPVSIIGLVRDNPKNIELLIYQEITEEPITFEMFCKFVADYCQRLYGGKKWEPIEIEALGFPTMFRSTKKIIEFLNASAYLQAIEIKIRNGRISNRDLKKLRKFQLIETRLFPIEYNQDELYYINMTEGVK